MRDPCDRRPDDAWLRRRLGVLILLLLVATVVAFAVAGRRWWLPPLASRQGRMIDDVIYTLLAISTVFFVAAQFFLAVPLLRSDRRAAGGGFTPPPLTRMPGIAAIITVAVLVVADTTVLALSERDWVRLYSAPPANALQVEVVARQFAWYFRYPGPGGRLGRVNPELISPDNPMGLDPADPAGKDNVITMNALHLVTGRPAVFHITSLDVLHSFNLPNFRVKQDAVPGRMVTIWTTPDHAGTYQIACAQLCGVGHYTMRGDIVVESQAAFDTWIRSQEKP